MKGAKGLLGLCIILLCGAASCEKPKLQAFSPQTIGYIGAQALSENEVEIFFDTPISSSHILIQNQEKKEVPILKVKKQSKSLVLRLKDPLVARQDYHVQGKVKDLEENELYFSSAFRAINSDIPELCFTQFSPISSKKEDAKLELLVLKGGNTAGMELEYAGYRWRERWELPAYELKTGDIILISFGEGKKETTKEQETPKNQNDAPIRWATSSKHKLSSRGGIALRKTRHGEVMDLICYEKSPTTKYEGYGSKELLSFAKELCKDEAKAWAQTRLAGSKLRLRNNFVRQSAALAPSAWSLEACPKASWGQIEFDLMANTKKENKSMRIHAKE